MNVRQKGFTIVELLIVIVVIAILAAITIVGYNGIQNRAKASQAQAGIGQYVKALLQYAVENQSYPTPANTSNLACFGGVNGCNSGENTAATTALDIALKKYVPTNPTIPSPYSNNLLLTWTGSYGHYIYFTQEGTGDCLQVSGTTLANTAMNGSNTIRTCRLSLPNPS